MSDLDHNSSELTWGENHDSLNASNVMLFATVGVAAARWLAQVFYFVRMNKLIEKEFERKWTNPRIF